MQSKGCLNSSYERRLTTKEKGDKTTRLTAYVKEWHDCILGHGESVYMYLNKFRKSVT